MIDLIAQTTQPADLSAWSPAAVAALLGVLVTLVTAFGSAVVALTALFHALKAIGKADANTGRIGNTEQSVRSVAERVNVVALATPAPTPAATLTGLVQSPPEQRQ